ncbi:MAG: metal-sensitive transcriptional regulator [Blastomonas sp.]
MKHASATINRFSRIAGQMRGIANMLAEERYCIDVLTQIQAVKAALARAEIQLLKDHAASCVADAMQSGDAAEQQAKIDEIVALFERARR